MKLQKSKYPWGCTLAAAAMALNCTQDELVQLIGHDGSEVFHSTLPVPYDRRAFHWQEIVEAALHLGIAMVPMDLEPLHSPDGINVRPLYAPDAARKRLKGLLRNYSGILIGPKHDSPWQHAVAWCREEQVCFDPSGQVLVTFPIDPKILWACCVCNSRQ